MKQPESFIIKKSPCPTCGEYLDGATSLENRPPPKPKDLSVCFYCAELLEFDEDLTLVSLSEDKLSYLKEKEKESYDELMKVVRHIKSFRWEEENKPKK